jgi:MtfA peptidase
MFAWLFGQRSRLLKKEVSAQELKRLDAALWQAEHLIRQQREQLVRWSRVFIAEKHWEGCDGVTITESMQWHIASMAGMMVLAYPDWYFDRTATILIHPQPYNVRVSPPVMATTFNATLGGEFRRAGETVYRGPVVLNWQDILAASQHSNDGHQLVVHEFAHQLDMINGPAADGLPPLPNHIDEDAWRNSMRAEYELAREMVDQGHNILMDDYGLTHESEFFAVASELYFQLPHALREYHPNVHELLKQFYVIDMSDLIQAGRKG